MKRNLAFASILTVLALAACGGGGSSGSGGVPIPNPTGIATPPPLPNTGPAAAGQVLMSVTANHRGPGASMSIAPSLTSIVADINTLNGSNQLPSGTAGTTSVSLNVAQDCVSSVPCTFVMPAPAGSLNITISTYSGSTPVSTASETFTSTGLAGQTAAITLNGIVKGVSVGTPSLTSGTSSQQALTLSAIDPSGATVLDGSYANPFTLTDTDTSGATSLQIGTTGTAAATATVTGPTQTVYLNYNGAAYTPFQINAATSSYQYAQ